MKAQGLPKEKVRIQPTEIAGMAEVDGLDTLLELGKAFISKDWDALRECGLPIPDDSGRTGRWVQKKFVVYPERKIVMRGYGNGETDEDIAGFCEDLEHFVRDNMAYFRVFMRLTWKEGGEEEEE